MNSQSGATNSDSDAEENRAEPHLDLPKFTFHQLLKQKVPFFSLSLVVGLITFFAQRSEGAIVSLRSESLLERLATTLAAYLGYLQKIFWPRDLAFLYLRPESISVAIVVISAATMCGLTVVACSRLRSRSLISERKWAWTVGWFWFVVMLLPVSGLVQVGPQLLADRYTYLAGIGLAILVAWGLAALACLNPTRSRGPVIAGSVAMLLACIALTRHQIGYWQNTETLMTRALQIDPNNYVAHHDLAIYLAKQGQLEAARAHRERVLELDPLLRHQRETIADR